MRPLAKPPHLARPPLVVVVVLLLGSFARPGDADGYHRIGEEVRHLLEGGLGVERTAVALAALGEEAVPFLLDAHLAGDLGPVPTAALLGGLARLPAEAVLEETRSRLAAVATPGELVRLAAVLARTHEPGAAESFLDVVLSVAPAHLARPEVRWPLEQACVARLRADDGTWELVRARLPLLGPGLRELVAGCVGEVPSARGLSVTLDLLAAAGDGATEGPAASFVLAQAARAASSANLHVPAELLEPVRAALEHEDVQVARAACLLLGRLGDEPSMPLLIELLEAEDPRVALSAHRALQWISGSPFPADPERWSRHHEETLTWLEGEGARLLSSLESADRRSAGDALCTLSGKRTLRHALAGELVPHLSSPDLVVARSTCAALGRLGSPRAVPALAELLDDPDAHLRAAASDALELLTGLPGRPDPGRWTAAEVP